MTLDVHVVSHTHWDREWYHPVGRFRQRLVALVDELLDAPPAEGESFLLDGQAIVVEDYLAVRPERRGELAALLRDGRIEAGPWYVLADELIPGGEALVRNLLSGRRVLASLGATSPQVLYCPDSFGHPAALPELAAGFGFPLIVAWRGFGGRRWPAGDLFDWRAPGGARALLFHLPRSGYEYGSSLPSDDAGAATRWREMRSELASRSTVGVLLVQNGADHHARQLDRDRAVEALARAAHPDRLRGSSLRAFAAAVVERAPNKRPPRVQGELRDSYGYTWTLQGTFATRAHEKRANAGIERLLVRETEPWTALARRHGAASRRALVDAAWRALLATHPHDTLCGCSADEVAQAMEARQADAAVQGIGARDDALLDLAGHDAAAARTRHEEWKPIVIVRNSAPRPRGGVAIVELEEWIADAGVGPGSRPPVLPADAKPRLLRLRGGGVVQPLDTRRTDRRTESPRHYPDNDLVHVTRAAVWLPPLAAYGTRAFALKPGRASRGRLPDRARAAVRSLENGTLRVAVDRGELSLHHLPSGRRIASLLAIEDRVDAGDTYTPAPRGEASRARFAGSRVVHRGPLRGELELRWRLVAGRNRVRATVTLRLALHAGSEALRISVSGDNASDDHRLRLVLRTDVLAGEVWADAAFGPVRREPLVVADADRVAESPPPTAPLHRYVSTFGERFGATLFSDGLAEYEAGERGELIVTLVRSVGELSRNDLAERPGHAGWPVPTPGAQCRGPFAAELALLLHGPRNDASIAQIERAADEVLVPVTGATLRSALAVPRPTLGPELLGDGLAFGAMKESDDGHWLVLRAVNLLDREVRGAWRLGERVRQAWLSRLDETPGLPLRCEEGTIEFTAEARAVVTVLVR